MASLNKVMLIGNLGRDPEMRYTANGSAVTEFSMAMTERFTSNGQQKERTEWANIVTFGRLAEVCAELLGKGQQVCVQGRMQTRSWEKDGVKQFRTEIVADGVFLAVGAGERDPAPRGGGDIDPDDLPF